MLRPLTVHRSPSIVHVARANISGMRLPRARHRRTAHNSPYRHIVLLPELARRRLQSPLSTSVRQQSWITGSGRKSLLLRSRRRRRVAALRRELLRRTRLAVGPRGKAARELDGVAVDRSLVADGE